MFCYGVSASDPTTKGTSGSRLNRPGAVVCSEILYFAVNQLLVITPPTLNFHFGRTYVWNVRSGLFKRDLYACPEVSSVITPP